MCNSCNDPFHGLDDDLDDLFQTPATKEDIAAGVALAQTQIKNQAYIERCPNCRGTGRFVSYSGRTVGNCFKCKGTGKLSFKTSSQQREASRNAAARAKARKDAEIRENVVLWEETNPEDAAWMRAKAQSFEFAASMVEALTKYGSLTERQHATITRLRLADAERAAARKAEAIKREENAPTVNVDAI